MSKWRKAFNAKMEEMVISSPSSRQIDSDSMNEDLQHSKHPYRQAFSAHNLYRLSPFARDADMKMKAHSSLHSFGHGDDDHAHRMPFHRIQSSSDDDMQHPEVNIEGYLDSEPPPYENRFKTTVKKKIGCKFCASSKSYGSCPCPIHLPAVRSRYMRAVNENASNTITINVFKNGENRGTPTMVVIPKIHMCSMEDIMHVIDKYVRFPVGYAFALYTLIGDLVEDPSELEPYETYVVVNNCKRQFIPMEYGSKKPTAIYRSRCRRIPPFLTSYHAK